jgi:hypothetical protein
MTFVQVPLSPNTWTQLPNQVCANIIFQKGNFQLAGSGTPGNVYFELNTSDGIFEVAAANTDLFWVRSNGGAPITYIWT